jgi:cation diffusion facilitator family transporter
MESVVNLVGALMALAMLTVAERPADEDHPFGHGKAEYFSSGVEGTLILIVALTIGVAAVDRLISPKPLEKISMGLAISIVASLANLGVAAILRRSGPRETPKRSKQMPAICSQTCGPRSEWLLVWVW